MSVVTGRRLQRFWQKGIKPLKDLLGNHDIADLSEDGTVTGALSKLNTDISALGSFCINVYSGAVSLNSNTYYGNLTFDLSDMINAGYHPIAVLRCTTGTAGALLYQFGFEESDGSVDNAQNFTRFVMRFRNPTSSAQSGTGSVTILFAKIKYTIGIIG